MILIILTKMLAMTDKDKYEIKGIKSKAFVETLLEFDKRSFFSQKEKYGKYRI